MNSKIVIGLGIASVVACSTANAFDTYVGLDLAHNSGSIEPRNFNSDVDIDVSGLSYGLSLGATVSDRFAIEVFYNQFENGAGTVKVPEVAKEVEFKQKSYGASINYRQAIANDFYGVVTVGGKRVDVEKTLYKDQYQMLKVDDNTGFKPFFGVGIGFKTTSRINIEAKYSRFEDMNTIGGTLIYRF